MSNKNLTIWLTVVTIIAVLACFLPVRLSVAPTAGSTGSRFPNGVSANTTSPIAGQLLGTTLLVTSGATLGSSGSSIAAVVFGSCQIVAYSNTITASSTATVDCSTNGTPSGTITGLTANQFIDAWATTTMSSLSQGVSIIGSHASTTAGIITLRISNGTGGTFTWSNTASTSIAFQSVR